MTLDEAINNLMDLRLYHYVNKEFDTVKSIQLGIEALKRCKNFRDNSQTWGYDPLPGETEE